MSKIDPVGLVDVYGRSLFRASSQSAALRVIQSRPPYDWRYYKAVEHFGNVAAQNVQATRGSLPLWQSVNGATISQVAANVHSGRFGVVRCPTGGAAGRWSGYLSGASNAANNICVGSGINYIYEQSFHLPALSTGDYTFAMGFLPLLGSPYPNCCYITLSQTTGECTANVGQNGSVVANDANFGSVVAGWNLLTIDMNASRSIFTLNGSTATINATIASTFTTGYGFEIRDLTGSSRWMDVDYISLEVQTD